MIGGARYAALLVEGQANRLHVNPPRVFPIRTRRRCILRPASRWVRRTVERNLHRSRRLRHPRLLVVFELGAFDRVWLAAVRAIHLDPSHMEPDTAVLHLLRIRCGYLEQRA